MMHLSQSSRSLEYKASTSQLSIEKLNCEEGSHLTNMIPHEQASKSLQRKALTGQISIEKNW
jgi:hypothetical protein